MLLENEGLTDKIRQAFIVYLVSNSRPIHELLNPTPILHNLKQLFESGFVGMTKDEVLYDELVQVRYTLIQRILNDLTLNEKQFIISVKNGTPLWDLLPIIGIHKLPSLTWKILNIQKMDKIKHKESLNALQKILQL